MISSEFHLKIKLNSVKIIVLDKFLLTLFKNFQFFTEYPVFLTCNCESSELLEMFK
jgi:hypothetical protein